jgi:uncharacterized protein (TIGR03083 family)
MTVTADDLDVALAAVTDALRPVTDQDWGARAGSLEWTCWHTAEHVGDVLIAYAAQLLTRPADRYVRFIVVAEHDASPAEMLELVRAGANILAAAVRAAAPGRAFHPSGMADPEGFAAMGCVETLVHGYDIAQGLGVAVDAPRGVCRRVLARLFPDTPPDLVDRDPWLALLWSTGRLDLPGHPRLKRWRWRGAPLEQAT